MGSTSSGGFVLILILLSDSRSRLDLSSFLLLGFLTEKQQLNTLLQQFIAI